MSPILSRTPLTIEKFEFVPATSDHGLVRVRGSWRRATDRPQAPVLVAERGEAVQQFPALPDPDRQDQADAARWRAAFALPLELLGDPGVSYQLEGRGGRRHQLPALVQAPPDRRASSEREGSAPERRQAPDRRLGRDRRQRPGKGPWGKDRRVRQRRREADRRRQRSEAELKAFAERVRELRGQVEQLKETRRQYEARMNDLQSQLDRRQTAEAGNGDGREAAVP